MSLKFPFYLLALIRTQRFIAFKQRMKRIIFLKLRRDDFLEAAVRIPKYLNDLGIGQIIPPLITNTGQLWTNLDPFRLILYPYVEGNNAYDVKLTDQHWFEFGAAIKRFHTADVPLEISDGIGRESFSSKWCEIVKLHLKLIEEVVYQEAVAVELAAFLKAKKDLTRELLSRVKRLASDLQRSALEYILCHGDIHAGNLYISVDGALKIIDWDTLIYSPKERDLMFVGGGLCGNWHTPEKENTLFYQGYGHTEIDPTAIAYYRYARIIEDIAIYCEQIFSSDEGGKDREQSLEYLISNYLPNGPIDIALRADEMMKGGGIENRNFFEELWSG
jgi:spectinomycin phosphotransferase